MPTTDCLTLQIIDGGLSNIAKMLDRLKTLATQSASSFTGDRSVLNSEYTSRSGNRSPGSSACSLGSGDTKLQCKNQIYTGGGAGQSTGEFSGISPALRQPGEPTAALGLGGANVFVR